MTYIIEKTNDKPLVFAVFLLGGAPMGAIHGQRHQIAQYLTGKYLEVHGHKGTGLPPFILELETMLNELSTNPGKECSRRITF